MNKIRLFISILGILNIIAGVVLTTFVILMQNLLAVILGILYIIFGIAMLSNKIYKKLLFGAIIPLTTLFSVSIIMLGIDKNVPEYFKIPLHLGLVIIMPLWILIFGNVWIGKRKVEKGDASIFLI